MNIDYCMIWKVEMLLHAMILNLWVLELITTTQKPHQNHQPLLSRNEKKNKYQKRVMKNDQKNSLTESEKLKMVKVKSRKCNV